MDEANGDWGKRLTKSGIEHIQSHLVALLGTSDCYQALIAALLGLVDLDNTATQVADLVDLSATLSNDGTDHVVRDIDLLGQRLARHGTTNGGGRSRGSTAGGRLWPASIWGRLMGGSTRIGGVGSRSTVRHSWLADRGRSGLTVQIRDAVRTGLGAVRVRVVTLECFRMAILAASGLRDVRNDLHATGNGTSRATTTSGIG